MRKKRAKRLSPARTRRNPIPRAPILQFVAQTPPFRTKGAFGRKRAGVAKRNADHARSCAQANELTQAKRLERAYREFYATPEGKKFAREHGKQYSDGNPRRSSVNGESSVDFCDPADLPAASVLDHPVDHIEPMSDSVEIDGLTEAEIKSASEIFSDVLRWGLDSSPYPKETKGSEWARKNREKCNSLSDKEMKALHEEGMKIINAPRALARNGSPPSDSPLVHKGKRSIVLIAFMRPDLAADKIDKVLSADFLLIFGSQLPQLEAAGLLFGRYLEWMRRSNTCSGYGERLDITAYMLRPDLLPASTLAKLGAILNKSRQAKDKMANCARDSFAGLKAPPMRNDITRARCRASQLQIIN